MRESAKFAEMEAKGQWNQSKMALKLASSDAEQAVTDRKSLRMLQKEKVELEAAWKDFKEACAHYLSKEADRLARENAMKERRSIKSAYDTAFENLDAAIEAAERLKTSLTASPEEDQHPNTVDSIANAAEEGFDSEDLDELRFPIQGEEDSFLTLVTKKNENGKFTYKCQNCEPPQGSKPDGRRRAQTEGLCKSSIRNHARDFHMLKLIWGEKGDELKSAKRLPGEKFYCKFCDTHSERPHRGCKKRSKERCSEKPAGEGDLPTTSRQDSVPNNADEISSTTHPKDQQTPESYEHTQGGVGEERMLPGQTQQVVSNLCLVVEDFDFDFD